LIVCPISRAQILETTESGLIKKERSMLINTNRDLIQPLSSRRNILPVHLNLQLVVWKLRKLNIFARRGDKYAEHSPVDLKSKKNC